MGGGLLQLVAYGAQDTYLTGNPQITLFKVVYRRHTNFSVEAIELSLETAKPGGRPNLQILRNGDLATRALLRIELPDLQPSNCDCGFDGQVAWVRRLGHALIRSVEIQIGGSQIDKHYGVWLDVWYELTHVSHQERGYRAMIGDVDQLTKLQPCVPGGYNLFIPLQFWFNRNYGLALPLIALQYHDVRLLFEFEELQRLVVYTRGHGNHSAPKFTCLQYCNAGVLIDYVYLDSEERRRFAQVGHEYLIEQLQYLEQNLCCQGSGCAPVSQTFTLNFNHPVKELIWVHRHGAFSGNSCAWFLAYSNQDQWIGGWENAVQDAANSLAQSMVSVECESPWNRHCNDANVAPISFNPASDPMSTHLIGNTTWKFISVNTTNIVPSDIQKVWILTNPVTLGCINLADGLLDVTVELDFQDQAFPLNDCLPIVHVSVTENSLSLVNLSIPLNGFCCPNIDRRLECNKCNDVAVIIPHNYGVVLDGTGNIVHSGNIQLNGHDRFSVREGHYFNYVQPHHHHTRTPADGVNVYSFALHPEQHQPTGSANMSRIDNTKLIYKTQDPFRDSYHVDRRVYAPFNYSQDTILHVFAVNYNVLRINPNRIKQNTVHQSLTGRSGCASIRMERTKRRATLVLSRRLHKRTVY